MVQDISGKVHPSLPLENGKIMQYLAEHVRRLGASSEERREGMAVMHQLSLTIPFYHPLVL